MFGSVNCYFDTRGVDPPDPPTYYYKCDTELWKCDIKLIPPSVYPYFDFTGALQVKNYLLGENLWGDKGKTYEIYWKGNIVIMDIGLDRLKGSYWIKTGEDDWKEMSSDKFLEITLNNDIEGLYIAYDSRIDPKPYWLLDKSAYEKQIDPKTKNPYYIETTMIDKNNPNEKVKFEIYRKIGAYKTKDKAVIPGNFYNGGTGVSTTVQNPAMYFIIIKPKEIVNCGSGKLLTKRHYESQRGKKDTCFLNDQEAIRAAENDCKANETTYECFNTTCNQEINSFYCPYPAGGTVVGSGWPLKVRSYLSSSEIEFIPQTSLAYIEVKGKNFKKSVSGSLLFEFLYDNHDMKINSMILKLPDFNTDAGNFTDIAVVLLKDTKAHCKDTMPIFNKPCDNYQIPQGEFLCGEECKLDGKTLLFASENSKPMDIKIDHNKRTFVIKGGPLSTMINIDGKLTPLDISINLSGHFVNFAPKAMGSESTRFVECGKENRYKPSANKTPVYLNAAGSFDIYEPLPTNPANYEWYEDYGLVTEKLWGKGEKYTIGQYKLGFGVHSITLAVKDKNGVVDTDTIKVTVRDTIPPNLTVPSDIIWFLSKPDIGPQKVDIGQAVASDTCSDNIMISNNAPKNLIFQPGKTSVTWEADDGRGKIATGDQKVTLISLDESPMMKIKDIAAKLNESTNKNMNSIEECRTAVDCKVDLQPLINATESLTLLMKDMSVPEGQNTQRLEITKKLEQTSTALKDADAKLKSSNEAKLKRQRLRADARSQMIKARNLITEIGNYSR